MLTRTHVGLRSSARGWTLGFAFLLAVALVAPSRGATATFREGVSPTLAYDVEDAELRSSDPDGNYDLNPRWNIGTYGPIEREVVAFPISLPAGATVTGVTLDVGQDAGSFGTQRTVELHAITNPSFTNETTVTWNSANTGSPWAAPGGDYSATVLSSVTVTGIAAGTQYTFASTTDFVAAVNSALAGDGVLRFLAKASDETGFGTTSFVASDSHVLGDAVKPLLTITYEVPEPASIGLMALAAAALFIRRRATDR